MRYKEHFLDTKGVCFLCLRESSSNSDSDSTSKEDPMRKVCLQNVCRYLDINSSVILLSVSKGGELSIEGKNDIILQNETCKFSVLLCSVCSSQTQKLTDLIVQLETLQMQVNYQLQSFHKLLMAPVPEEEEEPFENSVWIALKEKMISSVSGQEEIQLVELLRNSTKEKGALKIKHLQSTSLPIVLLNPLEESNAQETHQKIPSLKISNVTSIKDAAEKHEGKEIKNKSFAEENAQDIIIEPDSLQSQSSPSIPLQATVPHLTPSGIPAIISFNPSVTPNANIDNTDATKQRLLKIFVRYRQKDPNKREKQTKLKYYCTLCKNSCAFEAHKHRYHFTSLHSEKLFEPDKPPSMSDEEFKNHCREMFLSMTKEGYVHAKEMMKLESNPPPQKKHPRCWCTLCSRYLPHAASFRDHLVMEHYTLCVAKINLLQEQKTQLRQKRRKQSLNKNIIRHEFDQHFKNISTQPPENSMRCVQAQMYKNQPIGKEKYINIEGPTQVDGPLSQISEPCGAPADLAPSTSSAICAIADGGCGKEFANQKCLRDHKRRACPFRENKKVWICNVIESGCGKLFACKRNLVSHKKYNCARNLNRVTDFLICDPATGGCGGKYAGVKNLWRHKLVCARRNGSHQDSSSTPSPSQNQGKNLWICDPKDGGCGKQLSHRQGLKRHQLQFCPTKVAKGIWVCDMEDGGCNVRCKSEIGLRQHIRNKCPFRSKKRNSNRQVSNIQLDPASFMIEPVVSGVNPVEDPLEFEKLDYQQETKAEVLPNSFINEESALDVNDTDTFAQPNMMLSPTENVEMFEFEYETKTTPVTETDITECILPDI